MSRAGLRVIIYLASLVGLVVLLNALFPGALDDRNTRIGLVASLTILVMLTAGLLARGQMPKEPVLRYALIWILVLASLLVMYSYRPVIEEAVEQVQGDIAPTKPVTVTEGIERIQARIDGDGIRYYFVDAEIASRQVHFLVDPMIADVTLTPGDARKVGIDTQALDYSLWVEGEYGEARAAPYLLDRVMIGSIELTEVEAFVLEEEADISILGESFFRRLSSYELSGDQFVMRQ